MIDTGDKAAKAKSFGWGIIGSGQIAGQFAADLALAAGAVLVANYSRTADNAKRFQENFGSKRAYSDLDTFIADPEIDAVYIATPNSIHLAQTLKAIRSGKAILTEKPLAPSHTEASVIEREATRADVFAMEAMWSRFLPAITAAKAKVDAGEIGAIRKITAELAHQRTYDPKSRLFSRSLGGGASLDLGVYCVSLAMFFLGQPQKVSGLWHAAPNGVDMSSEIILHYDHAQAELSCGFDRDGINHFIIEGTTGSIRLSAPFFKANELTLYKGFAQQSLFSPLTGPRGILGRLLDRLPVPGRTVEEHDFEGNGLQFEAIAVMEAMRQGKTGSTVMPIADSISVLRAINIVLAQPASQRIIKL
ncbi:Gfo/Idh/MocA family oxidoreductase [Phyllobacterium sp. YR531]|uniref:Gfo/Idh/MocA family protein n=1 Tax=Phyllobacterium sp. YR531 TaxID=1144343 RepID=UPI00026FA992|nr:Gfo/Idh/MocA family oxidoreductase [Phyllobacterium sp. YR531]EJN05410.1 putative dehydrogenase [Phyllobacterium sp. YR531]